MRKLVKQDRATEMLKRLEMMLVLYAEELRLASEFVRADTVGTVKKWLSEAVDELENEPAFVNPNPARKAESAKRAVAAGRE